MNIFLRAIKHIYYKGISKDRTRRLQFKDKNAILFVSPDTGNLGDHLIAHASSRFIRESADRNFIEITIQQYRYTEEEINSKITVDDVIFINGGGFLGTMWMQEENMVNRILETFIENRIIILPQTIYIEDSESGQRELEKIKVLYNRCTKLTVCAREKQSYYYLTHIVGINPERVLLVPDLALSLRAKQINNMMRFHISICLRDDKESILNDVQRRKILKNIEQIDSAFNKISTIRPYNFGLKRREYELKCFAQVLANSSVVITDRLHCMIFCFLTFTPCIVINNLSNKIGGIYDWISDCGYLWMVDAERIMDLAYVQEKLDKILEGEIEYNTIDFTQEYSKLHSIIKEL